MVVAVVVVMVGAVLQERHTRGGVHHRQVGESLEHAAQVALHARAVDKEHIGGGEGFHVAGLQLIIVQAAGAGLCQADDLHPFDAAEQIQREQADGIEGGDDGLGTG